MKIILDLDETINKCLPKFLDILENLTELSLEEDDLWTYDLSEVIQDEIGCKMRTAQNIVSTIFNTTGFFKELYIQPNAREVIDRLHASGHEITIATKAFLAPNSMSDKLEWVRKYFPYANLVFCDKKINMNYDLAIEDNISYLNDEINANIKILLDRSYNQDVEINTFQHLRANNWVHINKYLQKLGAYEKQS